MKSTLFTIVLMAVSSMAMADITYISNAENSASVINTPTDITWAEVGALSRTITINSGSDTLGSTDYTNSAAFAATNVGSGGSWTYTLTFDIASIAAGKSITQIGIDFLSASSSGSVQNFKRYFNAAITLSSGGTNVINKEYVIETKAAGIGNSTASAYSDRITLNESASSAHLSITDLDLEAGSYTLSIIFSQDSSHTDGTFAGVGNIALHTDVPESSTAVLSLLAVVGLVARRRRRA